MTLPVGVRAGVEDALAAHAGRAVRVTEARPVGGGCISPVARVATDAGDVLFLKWSDGHAPAGLLAAEARGLESLADAHAVRVPDVIAIAPGGEWLLLEWLEAGRARADSWPRLGRDLAALHRIQAETFGADDDNFIGTLPQTNARSESWPEFWRERRLQPQLGLAYDAGHFDARARRRFDVLLADLAATIAVANEEGPSLLHGDLWGGNVHMMADGTPAVVDPSAYYGHREVDLAMAELFGGFGAGFRDAYEEAWPLTPGYEPVRRAVYQLYYLLVHVNHFGAGYASGTLRALAEAGG